MTGFEWNERDQLYEITKAAGDDLPYSIQWYKFLRGNDRYWAPRAFIIPGETTTPPADALNGHRYVCIVGGRTGSTPPAWTTTGADPINDGGVQWVRIGPEDRIASSQWIADNGLVVASPAIDVTLCVTTARLQTGIPGHQYIVANTITTDAGYDAVQRFRVRVTP